MGIICIDGVKYIDFYGITYLPPPDDYIDDCIDDNIDITVSTGKAGSTDATGVLEPHVGLPVGISSAGSSSSAPDSNYSIERCSAFFSVILIILIATGMISSFLGYVESAIHWKRNHHFHNFLHIFVANFCSLLPFTFAVASRIAGHWNFGDACFKILTTVTSAAQTACALQLAVLVLTCCREVLKGKKTRTNGWNKIVCFVVWLIAFASAWPCSIYESILSDVIKGDTLSEGRTLGAELYIKINTTVSFAFPALVSLGYIVVVYIQKREEEKYGRKTLPLGAMRNVINAALLYVLFVVCWLPYRAWRINTLTLTPIPGCGVPPDIFLYIGVSFSTLMSIIHFAMQKNKVRERAEVSANYEDMSGSGSTCNVRSS